MSWRAWPSSLCAVVLVATGCSLSDHSLVQCNQSSDCQGLAEDGEQLVCQNQICVASGSCVRNSDCSAAAGESPEVCIQERCVPLLEGPCDTRYPRTTGPVADDTVILGAFAPLENWTNEALALPILLNYELAIEELNHGELPPEGREFTLVVCDSSETLVEETSDLTASAEAADSSEPQVTRAELGFTHLTQRLEVPGIITALTSDEQVRELVAWSSTADYPPLLLSPTESTGLVAGQGLLWYLGGEPSVYGPAYAALYAKAAAYLKGKLGVDEIRAAAFVQSTEYHQQQWAAFEAALDDLAPDLTAPTLLMTDAVDEAVGTALELRPHLVFGLLGSDFVNVVGQLEFALGNEGLPVDDLPVYILSPMQAGSGLLLSVVTATPSHQARFIGVDWATSQTDEYADYARRLSFRFADAPASTVDYDNYYDAVYYLAYAAAAAAPRGGSLRGQDMKRGLERIADVYGTEDAMRESVPVGPTGLTQSADILLSDDRLMLLQGALGPAEFRSQSGTRNVDVGVYCIAEETTGFVFRRDALRYDKQTQTLVEAEPGFCFAGFVP